MSFLSPFAFIFAVTLPLSGPTLLPEPPRDSAV